MTEKRRPLVATMADEVTRQAAGALRQSASFEWEPAVAFVAQVGADALTAFIEDIEWYGETTVSLSRLQRFRDELQARAALRGDTT